MVMVMVMGMDIRTTMSIIRTMDRAALYRLMAWLSPAYPTGGFSYSHGLEYAVEAGLVTDRATLVDWIGHILRAGAGRVDAMIFRAAYEAADDAARLDEIADLASAFRASAETALESTQQGAAFLAVTRQAWPAPRLDYLRAGAWRTRHSIARCRRHRLRRARSISSRRSAPICNHSRRISSRPASGSSRSARPTGSAPSPPSSP